jgi:hypothetical protein
MLMPWVAYSTVQATFSGLLHTLIEYVHCMMDQCNKVDSLDLYLHRVGVPCILPTMLPAPK